MVDKIEDADIVVDLSGGKLAGQEYKKRIKQLKAENEKLNILIKASEDICLERDKELKLHRAAAKAAKSGLKKDLEAYIALKKYLKGE